MHKPAYYIINSITFYRLLAAPALFFLLIENNLDVFKWMLAFSFFTDAIDGYLARKYKVVSVLGARLDSAADDLTVLVGIIGLFMYKQEFVAAHLGIFITLLILFLAQITLAFGKYGKPTSFHTYIAKLGMFCQGSFLILTFFMPEPSAILFYIAAIVTMLDLLEEIILVIILPSWKKDVPGLYWLLREGKSH